MHRRCYALLSASFVSLVDFSELSLIRGRGEFWKQKTPRPLRQRG